MNFYCSMNYVKKASTLTKNILKKSPGKRKNVDDHFVKVKTLYIKKIPSEKNLLSTEVTCQNLANLRQSPRSRQPIRVLMNFQLNIVPGLLYGTPSDFVLDRLLCVLKFRRCVYQYNDGQGSGICVQGYFKRVATFLFLDILLI